MAAETTSADVIHVVEQQRDGLLSDLLPLLYYG